MFKLFVYVDKVSFNAKLRIKIVLPKASFSIKWLKLTF